MAQHPDGDFKVTDRRRRDDEAPLPPRDTAAGAPPGPGAPRSLADLFMMLASEAVVALGDVPDPVTGEQERALPHAAEMIDVLLLLRDKTQGNLTPVETQILEEILYDLQLRYVRATKSAG